VSSASFSSLTKPWPKSSCDETDIVNALMKNPDVLEVAKGLTWAKLRPVASAPDEPPEKEITPGVEKKA